MANITLFDRIFLNTEAPSNEEIGVQAQRDKGANPNNDDYKPTVRSYAEISADLRAQAALVQLKRLWQFRQDNYVEIDKFGGFNESNPEG